MKAIASRLAVAAAAAALAVLTVGCAGNSGTATDTQPSAAETLPNPFTVMARFSAKALGLNHPDALAVGPDGNLYVTDLSQRVTVISPAGKVLRRWGKPGSLPGEFRFITDDPTTPTDIHGKIAVGPDGKVYVSDSGNGRVQVFTPRGRFIRQFGSFGSGKGKLLSPFDLAVDDASNVYVVDDRSSTVTKFSPTGKVIWRIGGAASTNPDLTRNFHLASIDAHGRLVMMIDGERIIYVDSSGHEVDAFSPSLPSSVAEGHFCEVTVDAVGDTYVSPGCGPVSPHPPTGPTLVYDRAHRLIGEWPGSTYYLLRSPVFGPHGEVFALATGGSVLKLHVTLPGG